MYTNYGTPNEVYPSLVKAITRDGTHIRVRGTKTIELTPVVLGVDSPQNRLITSYGRPVNVAFAMAEVLWILRGRRDVEFLRRYNKLISSFSDDGVVFNAAYGHRLRVAHGYDQIEDVILTLQEDRYSRQATLVMWHPNDRGSTRDPELNSVVQKRLTKDRACNVLAHLMIRNDKLNWLQVVRSNDAVLGVPYNFMQWMSMQEYFARRLEVAMGDFTYVADSMHVYEDTYYNEIPRVEYFDLSQYLPNPGPMEVDTAYLEAVEGDVEAIWSEPLDKEYNGGPSQSFWDVFHRLSYAHRLYTEQRDGWAYDELLETGTSYAAAQLRFYWDKRWRQKDASMGELIKEDFRAPVAEWILAD